MDVSIASTEAADVAGEGVADLTDICGEGAFARYADSLGVRGGEKADAVELGYVANADVHASSIGWMILDGMDILKWRAIA